MEMNLTLAGTEQCLCQYGASERPGQVYQYGQEQKVTETLHAKGLKRDPATDFWNPKCSEHTAV